MRFYQHLPHRLLNRSFARVMQAERPFALVQGAIRLWIRGAGIDMRDVEPGPYRSLQHFFLRRLLPGVRPLSPGLVSPVDGVLLAQGRLGRGVPLRVKGQHLSLHRLVHGNQGHLLDLRAYEGGRYAVIFLTPHGYHYVHMPAAGWVKSCHFIPGRFFPQNERALEHIPSIYERNERAVLRLALGPEQGGEVLMVLVGASLVGGIELRGIKRTAWTRAGGLGCDLRREKGEELGHFRFGSTVVVLLPRGDQWRFVPQGARTVRMGEGLFAPADP